MLPGGTSSSVSPTSLIFDTGIVALKYQPCLMVIPAGPTVCRVSAGETEKKMIGGMNAAANTIMYRGGMSKSRTSPEDTTARKSNVRNRE